RISPVQSAQLLDRIPWPAGSCYVVAAPLFHATGLATTTVGLALGNHIALSRRFDPSAVLAAAEEHRAGAIILVPTMLSRILDLGPDEIDRYDTSSLKLIFAAGSALSPTGSARCSPLSFSTVSRGRPAAAMSWRHRSSTPPD
ncbi:AMP-binding protein, partial [Mycolicibacterium gadium]|uniref:AMP-binding protein n=1 Tax=Mycolicibacterium gadium TaxID=1794 RepID=UPI0021F38318